MEKIIEWLIYFTNYIGIVENEIAIYAAGAVYIIGLSSLGFEASSIFKNLKNKFLGKVRAVMVIIILYIIVFDSYISFSEALDKIGSGKLY